MGGAPIARRRVYADRGFDSSIYFLYSCSGIPHGAATAFRADMSALPRLFAFPPLLVDKRPANCLWCNGPFPSLCSIER